MSPVKGIACSLGWTEAIEQGTRRIQVIRDSRFRVDQYVAFGARPFVVCGLPIRPLTAGNLSYHRRNGQFFLEIVGHPDWGVPFGQDRLVLLYLATNAIRQNRRTVWFRSAAEILVEWGMPTNGSHYERLFEALQRVFGSTMFFGISEEQGEPKVRDRIPIFDSMKLWIKSRGGNTGSLLDNCVTLSPEFWQELKEHPIPVDTELVRVFARNPGCLDLYTWLTWRCDQVQQVARVPLFGPFGLAAQLGVQSYTRERKFRERIRSWLHLVRRHWPECPATVSTNGAFLELKRSSALLPQQPSRVLKPENR